MVSIAYLVSTLERCGPTNQLFYLVSGLDREHFSPVIVTLSDEPPSTRIQDFLDLGVPVHCLHLGRPLGLLYGRRRLRRLLGILKPTILHSQFVRADLLSVFAHSSECTISTQRNYPWHDYVMYYGRSVGSALAFLQYLAFRRMDRVIAVSDYLVALNRKHRMESSRVHNGVDLARFSSPADHERKSARESLGIAESETVILSTGSLIRRKDPFTILEAFLRLDGKSRRLYFVGDGPLLHPITNRCQNSARVQAVGRQTDVRPFLRAADLFVSASWSEGLPNAALEALGTGIPLVLSDIPQHREIAETCSEAVLTFRKGDRSALSELLARFRPSQYLRDQARRAAEKNWDSSRMAQEYQTIYQTMAL